MSSVGLSYGRCAVETDIRSAEIGGAQAARPYFRSGDASAGGRSGTIRVA
jgi:hypothetical protein